MKRELWGVVSAITTKKDYLIGAMMVIETNCMLILGMITKCTITDIAMLKWIANIKYLNLKYRHVVTERQSGSKYVISSSI